MICKSCGSEVEEQVSFCPACGSAVSGQGAANEVPEAQSPPETAPAAAPVFSAAPRGKSSRLKVIGILNFIFSAMYALFVLIALGVLSSLNNYAASVRGTLQVESFAAMITFIAVIICLIASGVQFVGGNPKGRTLVMMATIVIVAYSIFDFGLVSSLSSQVNADQQGQLYGMAVGGGLVRSIYPIVALFVLPRAPKRPVADVPTA